MTALIPDSEARFDAEAARRHEEAVRIVQQTVRRDLDLAMERAMFGRPVCRTFVCQGCGKAIAVLHGNWVRCECGVTSAAEVLP